MLPAALTMSGHLD